MELIKVSAVILLAKTKEENQYVFGAYQNKKATSFVDLPEDHDRFVQILTGEQTLMGFHTLEATPQDFPDAGRICVTHHPEKVGKNAIAVDSIKEGIEIAKKRAKKADKNQVYIVGGASIIKQCLEKNLLDEIELTLVYDYYQSANTHFVFLHFDLTKWTILKDSGIQIANDSKPHKLKFRYCTLVPK